MRKLFIVIPVLILNIINYPLIDHDYKNDIQADLTFTKHIFDSTVSTESIYTIDIDNDSDVDIIGAGDYTIIWWENNGVANFTKHTIDPDFFGAKSVFAADLNGDNDIDIIGSGSSSIIWWENDGNESFTKHTITESFYDVNSIYAIDVDGDNDSDILGAAININSINWWENDGNGSFTERMITNTFTGAYSIFPIDIDLDNDTDVIGTANSMNDIAWWENDGSENFTTYIIDNNFDGVESVNATDLDGDGDIDIIGAAWVAKSICWWENDGYHNFTKHVISTSVSYATGVFATDIDKDGDDDILSSAYGATGITWWENNGIGNFTQHTIDGTISGAIIPFPSDMDGDGDVDVVGAGYFDNQTIWWEQDGTPPVNSNVQVEDYYNFSEEDYTSNNLLPSQLMVEVCVKNVGSVDITGTIYLYNNLTLIGQANYPQDGIPLPPTFIGCNEILWDLSSSQGYLEDIQLRAMADIDGYTDIDPTNNSFTEYIDVYWADFPLDRDGYNFANEGYTIYDFLTDIQPFLLSPENVGQILARFLLIPIEWGGHCDGMATTSILYRDYPELRPSPYSITYNVPEIDAWPMIRKYQRNQLLTLPLDYYPTTNALPEFNKIVSSLKQSPAKPIKLSIRNFDSDIGHATVVYKAINTESEKLLFTYDNNYPNEPMDILISNSGAFSYDGIYVRMFVEEAKPLLDDEIKAQAIKTARQWSVLDQWITVFIGSPVETVIIDSSGNRLGIVNDIVVNEIPDGLIWQLDEKTILLVPANDTYTIQATGELAAPPESVMDIAYSIPFASSILEVGFHNVSVEPGGVYSASVSIDPNNVDDLHLPDGSTYQPDVVDYIENLFKYSYLPLIKR
jgi:hypothetical protein